MIEGLVNRDSQRTCCIPHGLPLTALIQRHLPRRTQRCFEAALSLSSPWVIWWKSKSLVNKKSSWHDEKVFLQRRGTQVSSRLVWKVRHPKPHCFTLWHAHLSSSQTPAEVLLWFRCYLQYSGSTPLLSISIITSRRRISFQRRGPENNCRIIHVKLGAGLCQTSSILAHFTGIFSWSYFNNWLWNNLNLITMLLLDSDLTFCTVVPLTAAHGSTFSRVSMTKQTANMKEI